MNTKRVSVRKATTSTPPQGKGVAAVEKGSKRSKAVRAARAKLQIAKAEAGTVLHQGLKSLFAFLPQQVPTFISWVANGIEEGREIARDLVLPQEQEQSSPGSSPQEEALATSLGALSSLSSLAQRVDGLEGTLTVAADAVESCLNQVAESSKIATAAQAEMTDLTLQQKRLELKVSGKQSGLTLSEMDGVPGGTWHDGSNGAQDQQ